VEEHVRSELVSARDALVAQRRSRNVPLLQIVSYNDE
jgi:hypothetical protein